jgi:hypothetical protein
MRFSRLSLFFTVPRPFPSLLLLHSLDLGSHSPDFEPDSLAFGGSERRGTVHSPVLGRHSSRGMRSKRDVHADEIPFGSLSPSFGRHSPGGTVRSPPAKRGEGRGMRGERVFGRHSPEIGPLSPRRMGLEVRGMAGERQGTRGEAGGTRPERPAQTARVSPRAASRRSLRRRVRSLGSTSSRSAGRRTSTLSGWRSVSSGCPDLR